MGSRRNRRNWAWIAVGTLGALAMMSTPAVADEPPMGGEGQMEEVDDADSESYQEMLRLSAEGNELYEAGQLEEAAETYARAYEAFPQPILLKNQMITRYLLEECEAAMTLGQAFMDSGSGSDEDRADVSTVLGECSLDLAEGSFDQGDWNQVAAWLDAGEEHFDEADLRDDATALRTSLDAEIAAEPEDEQEVAIEPLDGDSSLSTIAGLSLTGVGALTLGSALVWHMRWRSSYSDLEEMRGQIGEGVTAQEFRDEQRAQEERYSTVRWAVPTLYGVGAAATAAGVMLLVWPSSDEPSTATLEPMIGDGVGGAVFTLNF